MERIGWICCTVHSCCYFAHPIFLPWLLLVVAVMVAAIVNHTFSFFHCRVVVIVDVTLGHKVTSVCPMLLEGSRGEQFSSRRAINQQMFVTARPNAFHLGIQFSGGKERKKERKKDGREKYWKVKVTGIR